MSTTQTPPQPPTEQPAAPRALPSLIFATILLPIIGMIGGIVYFAKNRPSEGLALWGTAFLAFFAWYLVVALLSA
jgi:hypothetical protein